MSFTKEEKKLLEEIKPILEKLTFNVLKKRPDNIVRNKFFIYYFYISPNLW